MQLCRHCEYVQTSAHVSANKAESCGNLLDISEHRLYRLAGQGRQKWEL